jgi:hypothetical protein
MNEQKITKPTEETLKTRKRKLLTDQNGLWAKCKVCQEEGNLENLIRQQLAVKNELGVELYQAFNYVYFCSEACQGLFRS